MLVRDGGIRGLVVHLDEGGAQLVTGYELRAAGGVPLSQVSQLAAAHGLGGLTFAIGIPGSLGGAVLMNAGAYGGEMSDVIKEVTFLDENLDFQTAKATDLSYSYRHSYFMDVKVISHRQSGRGAAAHPVKSKRKWRTLRNPRKKRHAVTPVRRTLKTSARLLYRSSYPAGRSCRPCHGRRSSEQKAYGLYHQS